MSAASEPAQWQVAQLALEQEPQGLNPPTGSDAPSALLETQEKVESALWARLWQLGHSAWSRWLAGLSRSNFSSQLGQQYS